MFRKVNDFDGDGKADFAITRNVGGVKIWHLWQTTGGYAGAEYGLDTDENAAGDYDADGKTDIAVYRKQVRSATTMSYWFWIARSQAGPQVLGWTYTAYPESIAHHQDYDGDGKTDAAWTIDDGTKYFLAYNTGGTIGIDSPGGTLIKIGDMDGDGKAEPAAYNSMTHLVSIKNSSNGITRTLHFGSAGDEYLAADFDGDAKGDLTVFRHADGSWWWLRSSDNVVNAATFGTSGDVPVPADYDGDGKTDLAIWRSGAQSQYWVYGSQVGIFVFDWGVSSDSVVRY